MSELSPHDLAELARAKEALENPSLAIRLADRLGAPIDALVKRLPEGARQIVSRSTRSALETALDVALRTLPPTRGGAPAADWFHRTAVVVTGAVGGSAGLAGLVVELPISTTVMLRSIADHARAQGEDLSSLATRLECLAVFAYGSRSPADDAADSAYFAVRAALGRAVAQAAEYVAQRSAVGAVADSTAPALVHFLSRVAQRFGVAVADKAAAQLVPVIGAAGGAAVNALFIDHYQTTARAHFAVRRLVREHGEDAVRRAYGTA
jgi:EcsC protein family